MNNQINTTLEIMLLNDLLNAKVIDEALYKQAKSKILTSEPDSSTIQISA